jgi:hypothetical protein
MTSSDSFCRELWEREAARERAEEKKGLEGQVKVAFPEKNKKEVKE